MSDALAGIEALYPTRTPATEPYWAGLEQGLLRFQHCPSCGHDWLPPRAACPNCFAAEPGWQEASGGAALVSWVVYHTAYHPAFKERLPYNVAIVALDEGPRLISNILDAPDGAGLKVGLRLALEIEREGEIALPRFRIVR